VAIQESISTRKGVERILEAAFSFAARHRLDKVTMSDKSNALRFGGDLWQRAFHEISARFPDIEPEHLYIDALAMMMIREPEHVKVIVTSNMFGDIITDLGAQLQGGLGMAASGNVRPDGVCMFELVDGSAPKITGKNVANPMGAIMSAQMMLAQLGWEVEASAIETAVQQCILASECTVDLQGTLGTREVGAAVCRRLGTLAG
jgi:3-isopropylmalate dehydrogenase